MMYANKEDSHETAQCHCPLRWDIDTWTRRSSGDVRPSGQAESLPVVGRRPDTKADILLREPTGQTPLHGLVSSVPDILPEVAPPQCSHTTRPPIHRAA